MDMSEAGFNEAYEISKRAKLKILQENSRVSTPEVYPGNNPNSFNQSHGKYGTMLNASGIAEGGPLAQLWIQFQGIIVIFAWTAIVTWIILKLVGFVTDLRVSEESENEGLDVTEHEERSYDLT